MKSVPPLTDQQRANFLAKVQTGPANECWPWLAHATADGYGRLGLGRRHRFMATWVALHIDERPRPFDGAMALHSCDNPPCCNPAHLRWGTAEENADDREVRERADRSHWPRGLAAAGSPEALAKKQATIAARTHCANGHPYEGNTYMHPTHGRMCRLCRQVKAAQVVYIPKPQKTQCSQGHAYTPDNIYIRPGDGRRRCATCRRIAGEQRRAAKQVRVA